MDTNRKRRINRNDRLVLSAIAGLRTAGVYPSVRRLAAETGKNTGQVSRILRRLEGLGAIASRPTPGEDADLESDLPDPPSPDEVGRLAASIRSGF